MTSRDARPGTRATHPPRWTATRTEPASPPLDLSSAYFLPDLDVMRRLHHAPQPGYYRRYGGPNTRQLEGAMVRLEAPDRDRWDALATSSGMSAAIALFWGLLDAGAHVVAGRDLYGGTYAFLSRRAARLGLSVTFVESTPEAIRKAMRRNTRAVVVETITNPLMRVPDIPAIVRAAGKAPVFVDNTFATPILARPLIWGARAVWHSVTKYLGGHADVVAGIVVAPRADTARIRELAIAVGWAASPLDAWLAVRGIRTLHVRIRRASANAMELARRLERHSHVAGVHYPGLPSSPDHDLARRLLPDGCGGMLSFELAGGLAAARTFVRNLKMTRLLPSLGDVETTVSHPVSSSHAYLSPAQRRAVGISEGLVRVSAGIEDVEDIWTDLDQALTRRRRAR